jgi:hypothetical protein
MPVVPHLGGSFALRTSSMGDQRPKNDGEGFHAFALLFEFLLLRASPTSIRF